MLGVGGMMNAMYLRGHEHAIKPRQSDVDRGMIEHRQTNQEHRGIQGRLTGLGQLEINDQAQREYRKKRTPAVLQEMIARPSGSIHPFVAVMNFVKLPQYGNFVFDPMI